MEGAELADVSAALAEGAAVWVDIGAHPAGWSSVVGDAAAGLGLGARAVGSLAPDDGPPRVKILDDGTVVVRAYALRCDGPRLRSAEFHAVAGPGFLLTVRYPEDGDAHVPAPPDVAGRIVLGLAGRPAGGLHLLYVVLDELVDDALESVDALDEEADALEGRVFEPATDGSRRATRAHHQAVQRDILRLKRELGDFRRRLLPYGELRELVREEARRDPEGRSDLREVAEAALRIVELADNVRDLLTSAFEAELAQVSNETNAIMKKVTSWAAILLVPTLIAGIYGMNFRHMPELGWGMGYPGALGLMGLSAFGLWLAFRKQDWL